MFTYINFKDLEGEALNEDFEKECRENNITNDIEFCVTPCLSVSGHDAYIVSEK